ncbi:MAG: hypothetical protein AAF220_06645, partial [Pseudomonadota bacterium]
EAVRLAGVITTLRQLSVAPLVDRAARDLAASASAVVATILQALQPFDNVLGDIMTVDHSKYAAHRTLQRIKLLYVRISNSKAKTLVYIFQIISRFQV